LSPVIVGAIELITSSEKMINCEFLSHASSATPPIPAVAHILTHYVGLAFERKSGFKN